MTLRSSGLALLVALAIGCGGKGGGDDDSGDDSGGGDDGGGAELSCGEILDCMDACADDACAEECYGDGSADGQDILDDLFDCADENECDDYDCIDEYCPDELDECEGD